MLKKQISNIIKSKKYLAIFMLISVCLIILAYSAFAASDIVPADMEINGEQYLYWEFDHNITQAQFKYYGYGYTVSVVAPGGHVVRTAYLENSQFNPVMDGNKEKVEMPMLILMQDKLQVPEDYLSRSDLKMYLNARMGIRKDGIVTHAYDSYEGKPELGMPHLGTGNVKLDGRMVPLNKDRMGIANGIQHEYGVNWTGATENNLRQHFGIEIPLKSAIKWDRYKVKYLEIGTDKTVSGETSYKDFGQNKKHTEFPESVNGYQYSGFYKIDKIDSRENITPGNVTEGESATVDLKKNADRYIITFYYEKIDPSQVGKPVTVEVEYREDESEGKELLSKKSILSADRALFNLSSAKIDDYECKGYYVVGQKTEYFYSTNATFTIGKEDYCKPVNGKLKVIFIYEKTPYISLPKCTPTIYGNSEAVNIYMKRKDFENATEINIGNAVLKTGSFSAGRDKKGDKVEGSHGLKYFDVYVGDSSTKYYYTSYDNKGNQVSASFQTPKNIYSKLADDLYSTYISVTYAGFCNCFDGRPDADGDYGMAVDKDYLDIYVHIVENKPPKALFDYYTEKRLVNGDIKKLRRAYVGKTTTIENGASDPNGLSDIKFLKYTLKDSNNNEYYIKLLMLQDETYFRDSDNVIAENIEYLGASENGDIKLKFKTKETWTISQYVEDIDGLSDIYTKEITPEDLNLKPEAVISDATGYRYPIGIAFNGKQNRVVKYHSNNSKVAEFLQDTGIEINHNKDCWEIMPLDWQDINKIYFEKNLPNMSKDDNMIQLKYSSLNNTKLQFKQPGKYKIRLQVTDTEGNVSDWTEEIITINEDLPPQISGNIASTYVRNSSGIATITIKNLTPRSLDDDYVVMEVSDKLKYKYDSNNNGKFEDETIREIPLIKNGSSYEATLATSDLGRYQFIVNVKETFGQEYLEQFIDESDFKKASAVLNTHVDNIEPDVTLFEIWTIEN